MTLGSNPIGTGILFRLMLLPIILCSSGCSSQGESLKKWTLQQEGSAQKYEVNVPCTVVGALNEAGAAFESGRFFLPQLLTSAAAAQAAFSVIREVLPRTEESSKGRIILATVQGDIHDIGKNIVRILLENYGFDVLDLGKDVAPEKIVETAKREQISLIGLSALMTTTVANMATTVRMLKEEIPQCRVMVGGAALTEEYAASMKADFYSKDAMGAVRYAEQFFHEKA